MKFPLLISLLLRTLPLLLVLLSRPQVLHSQVLETEVDYSTKLASFFDRSADADRPSTTKFLQKLEKAEFPLVAESLDSFSNTPTSERFTRDLCYYWGKISPTDALSYANSYANEDRPLYIRQAIIGWATFEPRNAWEEIMTISNYGANIKYKAEVVLATIARKDIPLAMELFSQLRPTRACLSCGSQYIISVAADLGRLEEIKENLDLIPKGVSKERFFEKYWEALGYYTQQDAVQQLRSLPPGSNYTNAETSLIIGWAKLAPDECMDYVISNFKGQRLQELVPYIINQWAKSDFLGDLTLFLNKIPNDYVIDTSTIAVIDDMMVLDPVGTISWIETIENDSLNNEAFKKAIWSWATFEPDNAKDFVTSTEDLKLKDQLTWYFLLSSFQNKTLKFDYLELIADMDSANIRLQLIEKLAVYIADPEKNSNLPINSDQFAEFIRNLEMIEDEVRQNFLQILNR